MELSELGRQVSDEWWGIPRYYPEIEIIALQMMPDHLHGILFVREQMSGLRQVGGGEGVVPLSPVPPTPTRPGNILL